jgi:hypothetical protein
MRGGKKRVLWSEKSTGPMGMERSAERKFPPWERERERKDSERERNRGRNLARKSKRRERYVGKGNEENSTPHLDDAHVSQQNILLPENGRSWAFRKLTRNIVLNKDNKDIFEKSTYPPTITKFVTFFTNYSNKL